KVWHAQTGEPAHDFDLGEGEATTAWPAFSPDGKWLVTGTYAEYRFWEVGSWQERHSLPRANAGTTIGWIVFSPDGKMVALLHDMSEVRLVDPETRRVFARLPTGGGPYCFSPDGSQLVTYAGRDGAFQVWDLRLIRQQLAEMGLDWDLPPYPLPSSLTPRPQEEGQGVRGPLRVKVLPPKPLPPSEELDAEAHLERGLLYVQFRQYKLAWGDFNRAGTLNPKRPIWEEVVRAYSQAIDRDSQEPEAYHYRALAHERLGQWEKAIDDHSRAIQLAPKRVDLHIYRGKAYLRTGQEDKAAEDFRKAGEQKPWHHANSLAWQLATSPNPLYREPRV
ncbi:MAG: tetratricopeptide repeat protein, partial [Acidobacteria bacterium]|nr:tetratricopeptide repeat protein [Acidobacteriota bacterium]